MNEQPEVLGTLFIFQIDVRLPEGIITFLPFLTLRFIEKPDYHIPGEHWVWFQGDIVDQTGQKAKDLADSLREAYIGTTLV